MKSLIILSAVILTACDITRVGEDSGQVMTGCSITMAKPCRDSITVADDRCSSRALQWNPDNLTLREVCYTGYNFTQVFISAYSPQLLKDTLYWLEDNKGDTLVDGYAVYEYHDNGVLKRQSQWDLYRSSWDALPDTIPILKANYDSEGRLTEYKEIWDNSDTLTVLYNELGLETLTKFFSRVSEQLDSGEVEYNNSYYVNDTVLYSTSIYKGAVKQDSVVFDAFRRAILEMEFHPNGNLKSLMETTHETWPAPGILGKYESIYDEQGNLTQNRKYNAEGRFIQVKNAGEESWSNCTEPLQFFQCYL